MHAVNSGVGREYAHERIKQHFVEGRKYDKDASGNGFLERVTQDKELKIDASVIQSLSESPIHLTGLASQQAKKFAEEVMKKIRKYPDAMSFRPSRIL
jgi:ABC-type arginine transport system ATPase subunit